MNEFLETLPDIHRMNDHYPNNAPCEVDVADDHDVEMPEQLKLLQAHSSLSIS